MTLEQQLVADAAYAGANDLGETITYYPEAGGTVEIVATIRRGTIVEDGEELAEAAELFVSHDATAGLTEVHEGQDEVDVPFRRGETPRRARVMRVIASDAAGWYLEVRG